MDVLDDILNTLDLKGALYFRTAFSPPWAVEVPDLEQAARFHLLVQGRLHVRFPSGAAVDLLPGDLVLIPRGLRHVLSDQPGRTAAALETVIADAGYAGEGVFAVGAGDPKASTQMICGHFTFRDGADHPLLRALPEFLVIGAADRAREMWMDEVLRLLTRRMFSENAGSAATITRLSEVFFIEMLRLGVGQSEPMQAILSALTDRQIGKALQLMHHRADEAWTVESLAAEAGMSRSSFAERFSDLMGMGPMRYLSEWRLQKALSMISDTRCSVQQAAAETGYRSAAAFTRAFSARFGFAPRDLKRKSA